MSREVVLVGQVNVRGAAPTVPFTFFSILSLIFSSPPRPNPSPSPLPSDQLCLTQKPFDSACYPHLVQNSRLGQLLPVSVWAVQTPVTPLDKYFKFSHTPHGPLGVFRGFFPFAQCRNPWSPPLFPPFHTFGMPLPPPLISCLTTLTFPF